ncbi:MAG TPA: PAS domain-containing protein, partial [Bryobacteraceae bacterium]|nr:PAS domain-containing protein [Bryobacteraceae bacterium]
MPKLMERWQRANVLGAVFDQLSDALVLYDANLTISGVNQAAERLFGMTAEEMVGRHCNDVFRCAVCEPGCGMLVGLNQAPNGAQSTVRLHTDNGRERLALIRTNQLLDENGNVDGAVATIKDITEEVAPQKREIIAESASMRDVMHFVRRVA